MKFTSTILLAAATSLAYTHSVDERFFEGPVLEIRDNWTKGNCYSSAGSLTLNGTNTFQSLGACSTIAHNNQANVIAMTNKDTCYYGSSLPSDSDKVDDSKCSESCQGYPGDNCGASGFYRVYTNGVVSSSSGDSSSSNSNSNSDSDSDSSSADAAAAAVLSTPATAAVSTVTTAAGGQTIVVTLSGPSVAAATVSVTASSTPSGASNSGGGTNKAAIAAGVVVGIVGAAAIAGAIFFWLRSRKHREQAAELQRQNSIAGLRSEKPPSTYSMSDSRLEPAYMRRISDGSIADNQDYSRRILKVTNPDDR